MEFPSWLQSILTFCFQAFDRAMLYLPQVASAVAILFVGWIIAVLARRLVFALCTYGYERLIRRWRLLDEVQGVSTLQSAPYILSRLIYWLILLIFISTAIEALGLPAASMLVNRLTTYLPHVLVALVLIFISLPVSRIAQDGVTRAAARAGSTMPEMFGRSVQLGILGLAAMIALEQLGIASGVLITLLSIFFGVSFSAGALAFALGAQPLVRNILSMHYVRKTLAPGATIQLGNQSGTVLELTQTSVVVDTEAGRSVIPGNTFSEEPWDILVKDERS